MFKKLRSYLIDKLAGNDIAVGINLDINFGENTDTAVYINYEGDCFVFTRNNLNLQSDSRYAIRQLHR